ncbi:MAG: hypothetical protein IPO27_07545 [Bacteroidetes bacterium]|nr:hypothetical protein [Bacteroidota bacterium]
MTKFLTFCAAMLFCGYGFSQVYINETSGDATNNDSENDGIVELIGPPGTNIGCWVISNSEWVVVIPPGTTIPSDSVFVIACSQAQSNNPNPGSGIARNGGDFMSQLPIDFDVCLPANQYYVDWAATGFTIDNQGPADGDQIVLFKPDGSVADAVQWGGGSTGAADNNALQSGNYTLIGPPGNPSPNGSGAQTRGILPPALRPGGSCYNAAYSYTMPAIATANTYCNLTPLSSPHPQVDGDVLQACNSTFQRIAYPGVTQAPYATRCNGASGWRKSEHPNPGMSNYAPIDSLILPTITTITQCTAAAVPITLEVYNYAHVEPTKSSTDSKIGSFVSIDGAAGVNWTSVVENTTTGVTTLTYNVGALSVGTHTVSLIWDDLSNSPIASSSVGSNSEGAVRNNTTPSDCYQVRTLTITVVAPLVLSKTSLSCPTDFPVGTVNISTLVTGGSNVKYAFKNNGVNVDSNATGLFTISTILTGPLTVVVYDGSGCTPPQTITINNNCRLLPPPCPVFANDATCNTAAGAKCPGDVLSMSISTSASTNLPNGSTIEWVNDVNNSGGVYDESSADVVASQTISSVPSGAAKLNEVLFNAATETSPNFGEGWEVAGTPGTNIGCSYFTDGDFVVQLPSTAVIPASGFYVVGSNFSASSWNSNINLLLTSTATTPNLTNGGEYLAYFSSSNSFINGAFWGPSGTTSNVPATTSAPTVSVTGAGCAALPSFATIQASVISAAPSFPPAVTGSSADEQSIELSIDLGTTWQLSAAPGSNVNTLGSTNALNLTPACATYTIPSTACGTTLRIMPRINPVNASCTGTSQPTLAVRNFTVTCPTAAISGTSTACAPASGSLTINFSGYTGTPTFTINYTINGVAQTPIVTSDNPYTLTSATAGQFALTSVTADGGNCTATVSGSGEIFINAAPSVTISGANVNICEGYTGQIPLTLAGTTPFTLTYNIDGGANQTVAVSSNVLNISTTGLSASAHVVNLVSVVDDNGCTGTVSGTGNITVLAAPAPTVTSNSPVCISVPSTSSINLSASGAGAIGYAWTGPGSFSSTAQAPTITNVTAVNEGLYNVTVSYAGGCTSLGQTFVDVNHNPVITSATPSCVAGPGTGVITIAATIPSGTIEYSIDNTNWFGTNVFNSVANNTYTVYARNAASNNCVVSLAGVVVNCLVACNVTCTTTGTSALCFGGATGTATSTPAGGTGPYTYLWNDGAAQTTATATGLSAGTYTVTVTDNNGCTSTCSYTVTEPTALTCVGSGTNVSCNGGNNGTATSPPAGGTSPYTYLWSNGQTNATATGLIAGTYTATVTDANGCTTSCSYPVTEPAVLTCVGSGTNVSCNGGNNGTATSTPAGGTSPYTYLWSNGQTNATATGLIAGTYTATVTDANGCTTSCSYPVTEPAVLTCVGSGTNVSCNGGNNGTAISTPTGGTSPYTYLWSNGQTNATATGLIAGTYTSTVTDANGCTTSCSYTVAEPAALTCVGSGTNVSCNGGNNGTATSTPAGGTSPYTYLWSNGQTDATATGLIAGTYTATVTDANGCTTSCSYPVTEPAALTCVGSGTNVSCNGGNNGTATSTPAGGTSPYTYLWSNGQTDATATGLIAGTYTATVTDANGCTTSCSSSPHKVPSSHYRQWSYIMQLYSCRASSINMRCREQMYHVMEVQTAQLQAPNRRHKPLYILMEQWTNRCNSHRLNSWNIYSNRYRCKWMYYIMQLYSYRTYSINMCCYRNKCIM